ncbi:hypothetical protein CALVIDRAFT_102860 [Calocera viscosa TUFC12733]|uniref:Uncharacterized protein n=1 Tax=Calocera viscosa (strain TUFC12733) TaxID=1330018 RepID=A0A167MMM0_CALVF|nr:hypothetical protein CALVIDRAFT_102860 [Calocera viscosa TUFC12733]
MIIRKTTGQRKHAIRDGRERNCEYTITENSNLEPHSPGIDRRESSTRDGEITEHNTRRTFTPRRLHREFLQSSIFSLQSSTALLSSAAHITRQRLQKKNPRSLRLHSALLHFVSFRGTRTCTLARTSLRLACSIPGFAWLLAWLAGQLTAAQAPPSRRALRPLATGEAQAAGAQGKAYGTPAAVGP